MSSSPHGTLVPAASLPGWLGQIVAAVERRFEAAIVAHRDVHQIEAEIDIVIVDNHRIDAVAEPNGVGYRIYLYTGLLKATYDASFALMADWDFLPSVGSRAEPDGATIGAVRDYCRALMGGGYRGAIDTLRAQADDPLRFPFVLPGDRSRKAFALGLGNLAVEYILQHEFAHIRGGHCTYLLSAGLRSACHEANQLSDSGGQAALRRTLEWHADTAAARAMAVFLPNRRAILQNAEAVFADRDQHFMAWALAIAVLFRLLDTGIDEPVASEPCGTTHPHPLLRMTKLYLATSERLSRFDAEAGELWKESFAMAARESACTEESLGVRLFPTLNRFEAAAPSFDLLESEMVALVPKLRFLSRRPDGEDEPAQD